LINQRIRSIEGVIRTESFLYLKLVKQTYNWGAR
jgi:Lrp/AsnC family transcriptional regulator for asnA, asnC and gidA